MEVADFTERAHKDSQSDLLDAGRQWRVITSIVNITLYSASTSSNKYVLCPSHSLPDQVKWQMQDAQC